MIQNIYPANQEMGLYWLYFVASEIQFYVFVLIPSVFFYQKKHLRLRVIGYQLLLIAASIIYIFMMTVVNNFSTLLTVDIQNMFDELFRYPIGTVGYYSLGVLLAIFYFEYSQSISNRDLRKTKAYKVLDYIGKSRIRCTYCQILGAILGLTMVFMRYTCFSSYNESISP